MLEHRSPPALLAQAIDRRPIVVAIALVAGVILSLMMSQPARAQVREELQTLRHAGADRFSTAADVSADTFEPGVDVAYVATGLAFPDALSVGSVAGTTGGPILLTAPDTLPEPTRSELERLQPASIVVVGGEQAVSGQVHEQLESLTSGAVERISGADRFATAAAISAANFGGDTEVAYVATGLGFPDALAGGVLAARSDAPLLLTTSGDLPESTRAELDRLELERVVVLGGSAVVSDDVVAQLEPLASSGVERLAGANRYATAAAISEAVSPGGVDEVFLATGLTFPDALAGVPAAVDAGATLVLTTPSCVPEPTRAEIGRLAAASVHVLGGTNAVSEAAAALTSCTPLEELPPPTFGVDASLSPDAPAPPPAPDGRDREVVSVADDRGTQMDFVADELIIQASGAEAESTAAELGGEVLDSVDLSAVDDDEQPLWLLRVDPGLGDPARLAEAIRDLDPASRGDHRATTSDALGLLELAADEALAGRPVAVHALGDVQDGADDLFDRQITEAPTGFDGYDPNPFAWSYMNEGSVPDFAVTEAWRAVAAAGLADPTDRIPVAVLDEGCASNSDLPPGSSGWDGAAGSGSAPWHCTHVALTAAAMIDNGEQTAGTGGQVARAVMYPDSISYWYALGSLVHAAASGYPIANMSFRGKIPASVAPVAIAPLESTTLATSLTMINLAAAGNDGENVDGEDCFVVCWEERVYWPCELAGVTCVGGTDENSLGKAGGSNFGNEDVDLWAPFTVYTSSDAPNSANDVTKIDGTSFATPYVAGVVAMLDAAGFDDPIDRLHDTARRGDGKVTDVVQPYDAILGAFGGNEPPDVEIDAPNDGDERYAGRTIDLQASANDPDFTVGSDYWWVRDHTVTVASGRSASYATQRDDLGARDLTVHVADGPYTVTDTITLTLVNDAPAVSMQSPEAGDTYYESQTIFLTANSIDKNYPPDDELPDGNVTWHDGAGSQIATGHDSQIMAGDLGVGTHDIEVRADDGYATDSVLRTITVEADPSNVPPTSTIHEPQDNDFYWYSVQYQEGVDFLGEASDPEDGELTGDSLVWTTTYDRDADGTIEADERDIHLGTGRSFNAPLQTTAECHETYHHTVRLTATDSAGNQDISEVDVFVDAGC